MNDRTGHRPGARIGPRTSLSMQQRQKMLLSPGLQSGLAILRMPTLDLIEAIEAEAAENPFLLHDDLRRLVAQPGGDAFQVALKTHAAVRSLVADLHLQISAMTLPSDVRAVAEYLAGDLRDDGYLDTPLEEIAGALGLPLALTEAGLAALQACEPAGVGARHLAECLELQLLDRGVSAVLAASVVRHLDLFATEDWRGLRRVLDLPLADLKHLAQEIRSLKPHPVVLSPEPNLILFPDLRLDSDGAGGFQVRLGAGLGDAVRLNAPLLRASAEQGRAFGRVQRARAEALLAALGFRGETLLRIGQVIAIRQHRFFALGPDHLAPLTRAAVATELGVHPSTISRAVASKAMEVRGRILPLAMFFSNAIPAMGGGPDRSAFVVQRQIARLIEAEPDGAPLSDEAICAALAATGIDIARRTVAKYRGCMRIQPSFARRRRKAAPRFRQVPPGSGTPFGV